MHDLMRKAFKYQILNHVGTSYDLQSIYNQYSEIIHKIIEEESKKRGEHWVVLLSEVCKDNFDIRNRMTEFAIKQVKNEGAIQ